jgi:hypothetical protein
MTTVLLITVSLLMQRILGWPGLPAAAPLLLVPMVWLVAPSMLRHERGFPALALLIGLGLDLLLEPVVGPGGVAWSAAALACRGLASVIADRSARAWLALGAVGTLVVVVVHRLALLPLGAAQPLRWTELVIGSLLTGCWCGLAGWLRALDIGVRWRSYRARRLR